MSAGLCTLGSDLGARLWTLRRWLFLGVLGLTIVAILAWTDLARTLDPEALRAWLGGAGALGIVAYLGAFSAGVLLYLPGMAFAGLAGWLWGPLWGPPIAFVGAAVAVTLSFTLIRLVGGRALTGIANPRMVRMLARLDERPVRTIAVLRLFFQAGPPLNTALALTGVGWRPYVIGSVVGLVPPVLIASLLGAAAA